MLISCSPNLPHVYIRLCKHGNHFTFLQLCTLMTSANKSFEKKIFHRVENVIKQLVHTLAVRSSRYEARGKFGEHERCVRVARGVAEMRKRCVFSQGICLLTSWRHWFIRQRAFIELWSTWEVWRARKMRKGLFTRYDFVACDKLTTSLRHELFRVNQTYNSLTTLKSCRRPVVSLSHATKSCRVNRP